MILYLDENMPIHLAEGFQVLQYPEGLKTGKPVEVKYIPKEYGYGSQDLAWIPEVGNEKACVLTQDLNIHRRKHELELYRRNNIGMFFLKGASKKQGLSVWQMVEALAKNWLQIVDIIYREKRPFAYQVSLKGKMKKVD